MAGISILIVDDDKLLVDKLEETIRWKEIGISMVFTAWNIRQAMAILEEYSIQILLCDVDMPQGSGLELVSWIREKELDVECAFLSSYANFAYAQAALKLSSRDYLLKPISNKNLEMALSELVRVVNEKREKTDGGMQIDTAEQWKEFMLGGDLDSLLQQERERSGVASRRYLLQIARIWRNPANDAHKRELLHYDSAVRNHTESFFNGRASLTLEAVVKLGEMEWGIAVSSDTEEAMSKQLTEEWSLLLAKGISEQIGLYVGREVTMDGLRESWDNLERMEKQAVMNERGILYEEGWIGTSDDYQAPSWDAWEKDMLGTDNLMGIRDNILKFVDEQEVRTSWRKNNQAMFIEEFRMMLFKYLSDRATNFGDIFEVEEYEAYSRGAYSSIRGNKEFIRYVFEKLEGNRNFDRQRENVIGFLKNYIEQHIGEELSRNVLAKQVYLSEDYISKMFVKETGISIPNYITIRRMEKAKDYLKNTKLPVSRIAVEVGYSNFSYFSKSFREQVGCTPNEFRRRSGAAE